MRRMRKIYGLAFLLTILIWMPNGIHAGNIEAQLPSSDGSDAFQVQDSSGTALMHVQSDGKVGVKTTEPLAGLDVRLDEYGTYAIFANNQDIGANIALRGFGVNNLIGGENRYLSTIDMWVDNADNNILGFNYEGYNRRDQTSQLWYRDTVIFDGKRNPVVFVDGSAGNVGIGTTNPENKLHIAGANPHLAIEDTGATDQAYIQFKYGPAPNYWNMGIGIIGDGITPGEFLPNFAIGGWDNLISHEVARLVIQQTTGNVGIGTTNPTYPLHMASGAYVTTGGVWTNASSRGYKENIKDLTTEEAMVVLKGLKPTRFNYKVDKEEEYLGFVSEDVPELVATNDRKGLSPMDIVAVLTKVVQAQQKQIEELKAQLNQRQ